MKITREYYNYLYQTIEDRPTEELHLLHEGLHVKAEELFALDNFQGIKEGYIVLKIMKEIRDEISDRMDKKAIAIIESSYAEMFYHENYGEDRRVNWLYEVEVEDY